MQKITPFMRGRSVGRPFGLPVDRGCGLDGVFGRNTRAAILGWQRDEGEVMGYLTADQVRELRVEAGDVWGLPRLWVGGNTPVERVRERMGEQGWESGSQHLLGLLPALCFRLCRELQYRRILDLWKSEATTQRTKFVDFLGLFGVLNWWWKP